MWGINWLSILAWHTCLYALCCLSGTESNKAEETVLISVQIYEKWVWLLAALHLVKSFLWISVLPSHLLLLLLQPLLLAHTVFVGAAVLFHKVCSLSAASEYTAGTGKDGRRLQNACWVTLTWQLPRTIYSPPALPMHQPVYRTFPFFFCFGYRCVKNPVIHHPEYLSSSSCLAP